MPLTPTEYAESLLTEAVLIVYAAFRQNDFPEHYVHTLTSATLCARLAELRTRSQPGSRFQDVEPVEPLRPWDEQGYLQLVDRASGRVADAICHLWEVDDTLAERYATTAAQAHMAARLRNLREEESPAERLGLVSEVNRLRASIGQRPITWEEIIKVVPAGQS